MTTDAPNERAARFIRMFHRINDDMVTLGLVPHSVTTQAYGEGEVVIHFARSFAGLDVARASVDAVAAHYGLTEVSSADSLYQVRGKVDDFTVEAYCGTGVGDGGA